MISKLLLTTLLTSSVAISGFNRDNLVNKNYVRFDNPQHLMVNDIHFCGASGGIAYYELDFTNFNTFNNFVSNNEVIYLRFYNQPTFNGFDAYDIDYLRLSIYGNSLVHIFSEGVYIGLSSDVNNNPEHVFVPFVFKSDYPLNNHIDQLTLDIHFKNSFNVLYEFENSMYLQNFSQVLSTIQVYYDASSPLLDAMYESGYDDGFNYGISQSVEDLGLFSWVEVMFDSIGNIFNIELFNGVTIGGIALILIILALVPFIIGLLGGSKS